MALDADMSAARRQWQTGVVLVGLQFSMIAALAWPWGGYTASLTGASLILLGVALGIATLAVNRIGNFNIHPAPKASGLLIETGPYRYVRHPMYVAVLLVAAGLAACDAVAWKWLLWAVLAAVLRLKASLEETMLKRTYPDYAAYCGRTGAFVPRPR